MANCKHKWVFRNSDSYWQWDGRNSKRYHQSDIYYCEKCLEEKVIDKNHFSIGNDNYNLPDWCKVITKQVAGYQSY